MKGPYMDAVEVGSPAAQDISRLTDLVAAWHERERKNFEWPPGM